ncbi:MAG TPA: tandem-95 repeat protein, partial [Oceanospirillales bacterium]|nr:tandem-95 repeat protein [Oceanospirillales bacterium]
MTNKIFLSTYTIKLFSLILMLLSNTVYATNTAPITDDQQIELGSNEAVDFLLIASDTDGDALTFTLTSQPVFGSITGTAPNLTYTPNSNYNGLDYFHYSVSDGSLTSQEATITLSVGLSYCHLYPLALSAENLEDAESGDFISLASTEIGNHHGLLTWTGNNAASSLIASLTMPGNSDTYLNPDNNSDNRLDAGDWVRGLAGANDSAAVLNAMDSLVGENLIVPLWSDTRNVNGNLDYQMTGFAKIQLTAYQLHSPSSISYIFHNTLHCKDYPPTTFDNQFQVQQGEDINFELSDENDDDDDEIKLYAFRDEDEDDLIIQLETLPQHGLLTITEDGYNYQPAAGFYGTDLFTFKALDDSTESNISTITIEVLPPPGTLIADPQSVSLNENSMIDILLTGRKTACDNSEDDDEGDNEDEDGDSEDDEEDDEDDEDDDGDDDEEDDDENDCTTELHYIVITPPQHGTLTGIQAQQNYQADSNYSGTDSFTFVVSDGNNQSLPATVDIIIIPINSPPVADNQSLTTTEDSSLTITLTASDGDNDPLVYTVLTQPLNGTLTGTIPNLIYQPNANFNGTDSFTFIANDGTIDSSSATINIIVTPINTASVANSQSLIMTEDNSLSIPLTASDSDNDPLLYTVLTQPTNGTLTGIAPNLIYQPNTNFNGTDAFTFIANDGTLDSNIASIDISITAVNDASVADNQSLTTAEDSSLTLTLTASDIDNDVLSYTLLSQPSNGTLAGTAPNLVYTPNSNYNGSDTFNFQVNDGTLDSNTASIAITINPVNDAPVANNQSLTTNNQALNILLTGSDIDADQLSYAVNVPPSNGTLTGMAPNLSYQPNAGFTGSDGFGFVVNDGTVDSNVATVSIVVTGVNKAPSISSIPAKRINEYSDYQYRINAVDPDGDILQYLANISPINTSVDALTGDLTAANGFIATSSLRVENKFCKLPEKHEGLFDPIIEWG